MSLYEESNQFRAELEQQVKNVDIREITQLPNFKNWFNSKKAHSKCYDYDLPKLFYRTLNSIDNLYNIVNGNEQSRFVGEYFTDDLDTALTYVEHLENSKILIGFLNIQNPAIIDCKGAGWNEIRQNATITEQLAYFEYLGFNEKPDNFEENRTYPIDLRNDEKDEGISFFLQIKTINKDTTPSFIKITAPQYYQNDRSFRKTKFINLDMLGYGTPSLFNDIGTTNFWATNLAYRHRFDSVIFENLNDDGGRGVTLFEKSVKKRKMQGTVVCAFDRENSYFKHANNHGDFNPDDRRIFYSLFDIEQDFKQEKTEKDKTMENQQLSGSPEQELPKYDKYIARYIRDFVNDDSNFHAWKGDKVKWSGWASLYYLEKLANQNGGIEHFAKLFEQYKSRNRIDFNQTWRYRYMNETIKMLRNPVSYKEEVEQSLSKIRQELKEIDAELHRDENFNTPERRKLRETFDELLSVQSIAMDKLTVVDDWLSAQSIAMGKLTVVEDHIQTLQRRQEKQTMQQTQATQQTAASGGFSSPVENQSDENTANYDVRGLPEFSGVSAYFNNPKRQELVLAFLKTAERSSDLRHQHFIGIHPKQQVQFDRIAAFSPLELSAILDCKPEFANNMREYMAVVEDFERNHQQQQEAHKKAADALRISPAYQEMNDKRKNWARIDLYSEYIDGGEKFARAKTGEITNGDRLKQVIANAIDAIAPAVKYSLSQTEFWQERDDKAFIKQSQIRDLLRSQMSFPAEMVEVKTLHQIWYEDRDMHDTLSKSTAGFFTPKNGKTVVIADAFIDNPELAVFTAYHELGHRGIELQGRELWNEWLEKARQNPTVLAIADHAQVHYAAKGNILSDIAATEEALVEVFAAYKTQNWNYLEQRHNVEISQEFKKPQGTAEKLWHAAKNRIGQIFGRQPETLPDSAVFAMLGKLEQSLYQFPEWKQKLEKTVRVGQHNPFAVAKQPIISGRPRVNPTALTNRYRNGGLRFDLNTQDNSEFAKAVDDIAANGKPKGTFFNLGTTPEVWQLIGIQDMPVDIHADVMIKSVSEYLNLPPQYYRDGTEKGRHNLSPETLKQIPAQLNNPVAIFKSADTSTNPNGYVVLTELIEHDFNTGKEKPVIAALDIRKVGQQKIEVVNITSIYGRWDWQIEKAVEHLDKQGNKVSDLLYWHTTKGHQLANSFGLRLPTWLNSLDDLSNRNIKTEKDLLQYQKDKEMEKNQQQGTTTPEISENTVKYDAFSQPEKENTMNETEKQALAQAFKNLELPDRKYVVKGSLVEFQDRPESEIIAALAWDEFATAVKDYVNSQSDENAEKLSNAYLAYPFYNELANKGIRDDSSLRNRYAKVIESEFSSFHEKRTAALFILQSMWRGRGNSTDITRSYNIDAMTAYIARGRELRSSWRLENRVNEDFLTKNSIFTHKNLREMGLDNNSNLAPYAPELLQEMVKIEEQHRVFSQWQNQNSEGGWYNRGAENIIDFKQIPAAVQKDLILMVSDRYSSKRDMFGVYDNPVISMQHGLANREEVKQNLALLIEQQENQLQQYQKMGLGVPVPQEDAITQQINAYKETLEQVKNAPAVAFVPETLFVGGVTKPDWRTGEVQRYKTTEINTATGEITFVNDKNNPNPNPFGDMTEQARQYLSANNNFALAALSVAPRKMPENMKFDAFGQPMTENEIRDDWEKALRRFDDTRDIMNICHWVFAPEDIHQLAEIHENNSDLREKIEYMLSNANFRFESTYLKKGEYWLFDEKIYNMDKPTELLDSRIEKRDEVFNLLYNSGMANIHQNEGEVPYKDSLAVPFANTFAVFEEKTGNLYFTNGENKRLFEVSTDKQNAAAVATAFLIGVEAYKSKFDWANPPDNSPKKLRDIQDMVNQSLAVYSRMFKLEHNLSNDSWDRKISQGFEWYAEPPKTPQVKFDMFEQGVSMPTKNVETQPEKEEKMDTIFEFNNGYIAVISKELGEELAKGNEFVGEAALYHKDRDEVVAELNYYKDDDEYSGTILLFDEKQGRTNTDEYLQYSVDIANPNWKEDLAKAMVDFGISKESITKLNADKVQVSPEIVQIKHEDLQEYFYQQEFEKPRLGDDIITLSNGQSFAPVISHYAAEQLWVETDFGTATRTIGERFALNGDDYLKFENHQSDTNFFYCFDTNEVMIYVKNRNRKHFDNNHFIFKVEDTKFYGLKYFVQELKQNKIEKQVVSMPTNNVETQPESVSGSPKEQTAEKGGLSSPENPENAVKFDIFENLNIKYLDSLPPFDRQQADFLCQTAQLLDDSAKCELIGTTMQEVVGYLNEYNQRLTDFAALVEVEPSEVPDLLGYKEPKQAIELAQGLAKGEQSAIEQFEKIKATRTAYFQSLIENRANPESYLAAKIHQTLQDNNVSKLTIRDFDRHAAQNGVYSALKQYIQDNVRDFERLYGVAPMSNLETKYRHLEKIENDLREVVSKNPEMETAFEAMKSIRDFKRDNPDNTIKHDLNTLPETPKTLSPQEKLGFATRLTQAEQKVDNAKWEQAKNPNNPDRKQDLQNAVNEQQALHDEIRKQGKSDYDDWHNLQDAIRNSTDATALPRLTAKLTVLENEIKQRISAVNAHGLPYITQTAPAWENKPVDFEFVINKSGKLREVVAHTAGHENAVVFDRADGKDTGEVLLNTEQRRTPERTAEVLRYQFGRQTGANQIALINHPVAIENQVFTEDEIKKALNQALNDKRPETHQLALKSPRMTEKGLQTVISKHKCPETVQFAQQELQRRQGVNAEVNQPLEQTSGFSSPEKQEKEEELATVADDDGYERD